ncbi:uncharacterized protein LOC143270249 [Peromyscus maniculatus bairdii]|uniref:uncharacterized protein LOC143270249 n=1 Tax=Peromyscus maniculatus bairdii TaxID=230844 RepID=UPI003FD1B081
MSLIWGLAFPLLTHLSLMLLGFLVCGIWVLFSRYQSQTKVAAKTEAPKQQNTSLKQIRKLTVSQLEETEMNVSAADLTRISGLPTDWTQEYVFWSIDRSLRQIFQHLDNARSTLMELNVSESRDVTSSSVSDAVVQEAVPPSCYCKKGKPSTDYSMSSASSNNSSSLSYLPMFHEGTAWQLQSDSGPVSSQKEPSMPRSPGTALPTSRLTDPEKSALSPNLTLLPPLQAQNSFISSILESLDPCEQEKTKDKGETHFQSNHGSDSDLDESPGPLLWAPLQLSPLIRGELEGHMSQKVSTLQQEVVPLPVKKSWNILNHLMDVQGVPEEELPETQLPTLIPQSAEQNTNTSPDPPSFHLHMNIGVNSEVHRTEAIISQPFPSNRESQPHDDRQELRYNPLVISPGTPSPRNLEVNIIQEEQALVKKDSKHVLELNIEQRVIGLPEKRVQTQKAQLTNVELTPKIPPSATDVIKVTPLALLQVMDLMGINPEPQSEVIDSVGFSPQPPNQAETVSITPQPLNEVIEPIEVTHHQDQTTGLKSMASRLSQVTDDMKVTPVALFHVTDSMGMIDKLSPHGIEPLGIAPKPQYQVMESVKTDTLHNYQAKRPGSMSRGPQQTVVEAVEMIPQPQHKDMGTLTMTLGSQNQATKHIRITPSPVHENAMEISSSALPEATEDTKVSPVAKQAMDFMQMIPLGQPHITKSRALIQGSQPPAENLTPVSAQPDVPTTTVPVGTVESRSIPPQPPSKVLEPSGMTDDLLPSGQSLHALKVTPLVQASPTEMITPLQIVEPQIEEALELPSGLQGQVRDSVGTMPQSRGTECVSLTPGLSHQVKDPSEFTPWHQDLSCSEVSPRQSHNMTETMGLNWPQVKDPMEIPQSHHQIMESTRTIPAPPDQSAVPIGRGQKHQVPEAEVGPVIPPLQEMEYLGGSTIPQSKVRDSVDLPPELQSVKSEHLTPDPILQSMKSMDITTELVPEMEKYGPPTSTVVCIDLAQELHQQNMQYEELTPIPQLQSETSVPSAPESQFQDVKSGQLTVEPQLQNKKSAELTPCPQLHSNVSVHLISDSQSQGMEEALLALSQEIQGDIKMVELTPRPSLEDIKSVNLAPEPCSQITGSDKIAPVPLLEDTKTPFVEGRSLLPEAQVESMEVGELIPSTQFYATKSLEETPKPSYHFLEPEGPTLQHPASEARVTSDPCRQVEESAPLPQSSLGMSPAPLSQTSESVEMSSPPLQETLEPGTQVVKEMEETSETGSAVKDTLDFLLDSEVQTMTSGVMAPETQPPDVKFVQVTLDPCAEVTNPSERTLKPEDEDTETFRLTFSKADDTQGTIIDLYSEVRSLEFSVEPGVQGEKSESFAQNLKSAEVITEPTVQVVEPAVLSTEPKPHIKDVIPRPQLQEVKSRQMDRESQLQNENSVNVIQPSSAGEVDPEKTKPEPRLQSLSLKERIEGTQSPNVKSVDLNLGPQQLSVKSKLIPGPKLQSVQFPMLYQGLLLQGENPVNFISGPPHYGVKSDDEIPCSLGPETRSSDFILGPKLPEPQPQPQTQPGKPVDINIRPCLHHVRFSDAIPEAKHQGFKCVQFMPGVQLQDRKPQTLMPESFLPLSQETQVEDKKLVLPPELSEFCSMKRPIPASELQHPRVIAKQVNPGLWHQDTKFSELASRRKYQRVKFGEQTPGSLSHGMSPMAPELWIHDPKSAKVTPGLQDTRQVSFNSGPWLQDVQFLYAIPGTQPQGVKTSKLNSGPQLECVKMFELTPQPERQGMKPELIVQEPPFKDIKYVTRNLVPNFEGKMSYQLASEPQIPNAESKKLTPEKHLAGADHSGLIRRAQAQGVESSTLIHRQHLGHIKPVEKITASKQEELTPGPHLEGIKSMELRSKSELGKIISKLSTPGIQAGDKEHEELPPCSTLKGLKSELPPSGPQLEDRKSAVLTLGQCLERIKSTVISPSSSQSDGMKSVKLIPGSRIQDLITVGLARDARVQDINAMGLEREPKKQGESPGTFAPGMLFQDKPMEVLQEPHQHNVKPMELTSRPQTQDSKRVIVSCLKQQSLKPVKKAKTQGIQGVKFMDLVSTQQYQGRAPMDLTLEPGRDDHISSAEWKGGMFDRLNKQLESEDILSLGSDQEPKPAGRKPIELSSKLQCKDAPSYELAPEPVVHNVKAQEVQYGPQALSMKPCPLTPESEVYQVKALEPMLEPPLQDGRTVALNTEPQSASTKSVQWIPASEFQREKCIGSNFRLQSQSASPTELKPSTQRRGVRSSDLTVRSIIQGEKSRESHLESQLQQVKASPLALGLQKTKTFNLTSEPRPQGIKTDQLNKETQVESIRSIQWIPGPEFHGVTFLQLNSGSPSPGVKSTEQKPSIQLEGGKTSEMALGPKPLGKKSVDFNLGQQVQCVKTPELSPGPELQEGENITSTSELQSQCGKSVALHQGPLLENTKSVLWIPLSDCEVNKSTLNLRLPPQDVTAKELKPSVQLDVKTSNELTMRPKSQGKQPSGSTQEHQSQRSKTTDFKSEQQFRIMKACNPTLRSKTNNIKLTFKPRFCLEDRSSPGLNPGIQPQEGNSLGSSPGTQPKTVTPSVFKQESQSSEVKYGAISQRPQSQNNVELKCGKSSELALQTKPQGMKSENSSGPQCRHTNCSDLTPERESPDMKCTKSSRSSQLKGKPCIELATGTKTRPVKLGCKPGPQWQGIKSNSFLRTKPQEMEMEDWESGPQLQDLKSSRTIMGIKVHDVMSVDFGPGPHLQGMTSEVITGKRAHGMKSVEIKPRSKLQGKKHDFTPRKMFLGTKSVELDSGPPLKDLKYPELIMGMKLQGVNSMGQHVTSIKSSEVVTQIKPQGVTAVDLNSGPRTQNKKPSELAQGQRLLSKESVEFSHGPKLQGVTVESKPPNGESGKLNSGPQLQDEKYSQSVLGTKLQYGRSMEVSPGLCSQGMKSSKVISEDKLQKEKPIGFVYQPLWQDVKSLKWTFGKALDREPLQLETAHLQDRKLTMLTPELHLQGMKPELVNCGSKLKGVKSEPTYVQTVKDTGINPGAESQFVGISKQASDSKIYTVVPSEFNARNQKRDRKSHKLSQKHQLQKIKQIAFRDEPHLQHIKSSELCTKLQDLKSMEFNSEQQLQDVMSSELGMGTSPQCLEFNPGPQLQDIKSSEVCTETKLPDEPSPEFKHKPTLQDRASCDPSTGPQIHCKNVMASNTRTQNVELSELHPGPDFQGIKSKVFCLGQHLEDVNYACTPNANSQYINSSGCKCEPYLQDINNSACIPEPDPQCIKSVCSPGPHLHGTNSSACILGPKLQFVDTTGCIHEPNWQDVNSSICTPGPSPQCMSSSVCTPRPSPQCVNSSVCTPGTRPRCVNSSPCSPGPSPRCVNSACTPGPSPQCVNSACTTGPSPPCVNSTECHPEAHLQGVNQWASILGPHIQCVGSIGCNPKSHYQGVNPSSPTPGPNPQCEHSNRCSLEPLLLGMNHGTTFPAPQIMCVNPVWCNTKTHLQDVDSSACTGRQESQSVNSTGYNPGPHLQAPTPQDMNFSELNSGTGIQREMPIIVNQGRHIQDLKLESTPGSSHLMVGAEFPEIPFLKNQLGLWQDTAQPVFTLRPPSNGVKSVGVSPTPLPEDRMSPEMSKQPLLCLTNSVKVTPGCSLQDLRSKEFSPEPCFQKVKSVKLKPGSPTPSVNPLEFAPCHCSQRTKTSFAQKPCVHERKPMQLRLGSQQQSMDCQQFPLNEKPVISTPESTGNFLAGPALSSVKFSNLILESHQQCMKSMELASEPKWQSVNHVKLSSVSLPQTGTSVGLSPRPFLQNVTPGNQNSQTRDQIIESSQVIHRPEHQIADCAEKMRRQVSKLVDFISLPVSQDAGSSEMTKGLRHKSPETTEKNMRLTPKPTDQDIESLGMPQQLDLQGPESVDLTPTLSDPDWKSSELTPQKGYWSPETLQLLPCLWPQFKDYKELPTEQATGSHRMTLDLKNHVAEVRMLTCEVRPWKEYLSVPSKPVNRETGHVEKSPRPCPQDLGPVVVSSGKRAQREQSVASPPRPSYHVPDSVSGITPGHGPQIPESVSLTSKPWLQIEEFLELSTQQTSQVVEDTDCEELTFESWQPGEVASRLTKAQGASMGTLNITPIESLDQMINFITISPKQLGQVTESTKTRHHVSQSAALPKVSESVEVIPGPPFQVIESVMIPEPASQGSKHADLTPKLHDVIMSEFASSLWLQNVQSKKLVSAPTHQILETIQLSGFQVIKTILVPKPLLLIVKSEELAPGPNPQAMEPIGAATKSSIKVMDGLNLLPRPHLQDMIKPTEQTPRANIQENFAELILQQTSPLEEPPVLTHEQRLQAENSLGIRTESPKVMEIEDLNQRRVCEDRDSEMITSEKLQAQNYFSSFIPSPSIPLISSCVKTTELGPLQGSGMPEVSRALAMKNLAVSILPSPESYTDTIMFRPSALPLVLPSDIGNTVGSLYPDIWEVDVLSKEATEKKQMEEFENSFQSYSPYPLRLLPSEFQAGLGARRNSIRSFLGRQQNVWESHVCRQRLPRKYLSNMLMLGNVLGTTMERKLCSQPFLTEGATMDICHFIQNLFGVPAELMAFSQSPLERGLRTISQTSVVKNYIQRHILCHGHEKRMPLKMWTRGSTSSIIQQYSGTRLGIKKTNSKLSDIFQEVTQNVSVSCTRAQFPALMKPESSLKILYNREDAVSSDQSKDSQSESQTRPSDSHHSLKASCLSQAKRDISEQLHLLKDLQLKIAAKLLESQVPHNVPPPFSSGLVLKYPICLQCGRCSGINCCHKLQSAFGPYLLIYPQIHLLSTPEGHGEIRLHLGFRLRTGKRPQVSKHRGRKRADAWKSTTSPSRRKAKIYPPASKSPTTPRHFQARSPQAPASVQVLIRKKQWGSHGVVGKTDTEDFEHREFCQVHSVSESGFESNQEEKWSKSSLKKTFGLKYPMKETIKGRKTQKTKLNKNSGTPEESPFRIMCPSRSKSVETVQTSTASSKTQAKKSSQPKFYHLLFQGLRQAFQIAHRIVAYTGQKPADRTRPDNLWSTQYLHPKQKPSKYCLAGDGKGASTPVAHQKSAGVNPKQEDRLQGTGDQCRQTQQPKQVSSLQPRPLQLETMASERDATFQVTSVIQPLSIVQNVNGRAKNNYGDEISCLESKNCSQVGAKCQAQERIEPDSHLKRSLQSHFKETHTPKEEQHGFFRERDLCNKPFERTNRILLERIQESLSERRYRSPSQRRHSSPSDRMLRHLSERRHCSPSQRQDSSPSVRTLQSISDWSLYSLFKGVGRSPSGRSRPNPGRRPRSPSRRSLSPRERRGRERRGHSPSKRCHLSPLQRTRCSPSERSHGSLSERTPFSPSGRKRHNSSGRVHHLPSESRLYRSSSRLHRSHPERTHYSPFEIRHSYSERSRQGHNEGPHHSTKERLRGKEKPRHSLSIKTSRLINS